MQPRALRMDVLSETDREHMVSNIVGHLSAGVQPDCLARAVEYWRNVHPDLGERVVCGGWDGRRRRRLRNPERVFRYGPSGADRSHQLDLPLSGRNSCCGDHC